MTETENKKMNFNIPNIIRKIKSQKENAKITFFHRYIYQENDPKILTAIYTRIKKKLVHMGILSKTEDDIDKENLENAIEQFENDNELFYVTRQK